MSSLGDGNPTTLYLGVITVSDIKSHSIWRYAGIYIHTHSCQYSTQGNVIVQMIQRQTDRQVTTVNMDKVHIVIHQIVSGSSDGYMGIYV